MKNHKFRPTSSSGVNFLSELFGSSPCQGELWSKRIIQAYSYFIYIQSGPTIFANELDPRAGPTSWAHELKQRIFEVDSTPTDG